MSHIEKIKAEWRRTLTTVLVGTRELLRQNDAHIGKLQRVSANLRDRVTEIEKEWQKELPGEPLP